jgi:hypothetical protein
VTVLDPSAPPDVLHNMSARPRTPVTCTVKPLRASWATFALDQAIDLTPAARTRLNRSWAALGFTGAALVHPGVTRLAQEVSVQRCIDQDLATNVVLRTRGRLLLAEMDLVDHIDGLVGATFVSSDPRLVTWARGGR